MSILLYSIVSVTIVSLISLVGALTFSLKEENLKKILLYLVSFSAGGLFGDAFIHLIPEAMEGNSLNANVPLFIILGIVASFTLERFLQWRHCHIPTSKSHPHTFAYMNLFGDAVHNFIDGLVIGASYIASTVLGTATTLAVIFHEIPQEIGDFGVLVYGGFSRTRALIFNFSTALTAVVGTILAITLGYITQDFVPYMIPFAAGNFIYIAGSDLIPELHKEEPEFLKSLLQLATFGFGVIILLSLTFFH